MKKTKFVCNFFSAALVALLMASCGQDEITEKKTQEGREMQLSEVKTEEVTTDTRGAITPVTSWSTADIKDIAVTVYRTKAANNVMIPGETINQKWTFAAGKWSTEITPVMNDGDHGFVTAYYPWAEGNDPKALVIDNTKDWMYSKFSDDQQIDPINNTTSLTMCHATTQIKIKLYRKGYTGTGHVTSVSVKSNKMASSAILNTTTGELSGHTLMGRILDESIDMTLGEMGGGGISEPSQVMHESFVPVDDAESTVQFDVTVDGIMLRLKVDQHFEQGKIYTYKLNVTDMMTMELTDEDGLLLSSALGTNTTAAPYWGAQW